VPFADYLTPKAEIRPLDAAGDRDAVALGIVATQHIAAGETVAAFGGSVTTRREWELLGAARQAHSVQLDDDLFLVGTSTPEPGDVVNHSCSPNCGMSGATLVVAMRDILAGEELTYDYAMTDGSAYDEFECRCGSDACRGKVTGEDWMLPELQIRYRGFFSPYLARRISALVGSPASRRSFAY
jgi:hypothetical protein